MKHIAKRKKTVSHKVRIVKGTACKDGKEYKSWTHYEYDSKGKIRHLAKSDGYEKWYDADGNVIHEKHASGSEIWDEYDAYGHMIHSKWSDGYELWNDYDSKGNLIHEKNTIGYERWCNTTYKKIKGKSLIEWDLST